MTIADALSDTAVVVVNYRSHDMIERNLCDLDQSAARVTFVIVDSFSSEDEREAMRMICDRRRWRFVAMADNAGFGAGANAGVRALTGLDIRTILFLNPDAHIDGNSLVELASEARRHPNRMISPVIHRPDGSLWFGGSVTDRRTGLPGRAPVPSDAIHWLTGACLVIPMELWQRLQGFDDDYFMYWEDVDLSYRCAVAKGDLAVIESIEAVHDVGGTQAGGKSPLYVRYCCRNRLVFAAKHLSRREVLRWLAFTPRSSWLIARRAARRRDLLRSYALLSAMVSGTSSGAAYALSEICRPKRAGRSRPGAVPSAST